MFSVAIDGPAGAGKSTISRRAAKNVGFIYVDTGALYRAVGLSAMEYKIDLKDSKRLKAFLLDTKINLEFRNGEQHVLLNGSDVSDLIRTPEVSMMASKISAVPAVREFLFDLQQSLAKLHNVVMDGRDIGTVVLPHAQLKIFLTASPEERARRRFRELIAKDPATRRFITLPKACCLLFLSLSISIRSKIKTVCRKDKDAWYAVTIFL